MPDNGLHEAAFACQQPRACIEIEEREMIGFAVLGCGRIDRIHARNIRSHRRANLVSCYDVVSGAADDTARELGVKAAGSINEVLSDGRIQAVFVASTTDTHVDLITLSVKAGKAVLCEKPIDLDIGRVDACWREIGGLDPVLMIGFNRRFDPSFKALRERIQTGEIGNLEQVVIASRDPDPPSAQYIRHSGGLFRDMTIHDFDMALSRGRDSRGTGNRRQPGRSGDRPAWIY
jgi:myo-inositol 2-dehydrogenase/D-chiro-inositol 1-dehydrogenase